MSFAPEDHVLIQCSRTQLSDEAICEAIILLQQDLDWDYILEAAIIHAVAPLLYCGLEQVSAGSDSELIPAYIMQELEKLYYNSCLRNRRLYHTLGEIAKAFNQHGIAVMGLKDIHLAQTVYPEAGLRPMGDIDLLIHPEDYDQAAACMRDLGFTPLPGPDIPFTLKYAWDLHFRRPADNVWVDLQWNLLQMDWSIAEESNFDFEIDRMWRSATPLAIEDYSILVPRPEDILFHLCMHLEGHAYSELVLFCDLVEFLRHYQEQIDWEYLIEISKKYKVESSIYYVLLLLTRLFKVDLPAYVLPELETAYFKASIFDPLFGNLASLHYTLDEIHLTVLPPGGVMAEFEAIVRRQTVAATRLYEELDSLASGFAGLGGEVLILQGEPSEVLFPERSPAPFRELRYIILDKDLPVMLQALANCGFEIEEAIRQLVYSKRREITSADPQLADQTLAMVLQAEINKGGEALFQSDDDYGLSKKALAMRAIRAKLRSHNTADPGISVEIKIISLSAEEMVFYQCARLGNQKHNRLFGLCSLYEFFRRHPGPPDWQRVSSLAQRYHSGSAACEGLLMVDELLKNGSNLQEAVGLLSCPAAQPRVLEWARYDPETLDRYTSLKGSFFYLFSLLSIKGMGAKSRYVFGSFIGQGQSRPVLLDVISEAITGSLSLVQKKKQHTARDFAYWAAPELKPEAELVNQL